MKKYETPKSLKKAEKQLNKMFNTFWENEDKIKKERPIKITITLDRDDVENSLGEEMTDYRWKVVKKYIKTFYPYIGNNLILDETNSLYYNLTDEISDGMGDFNSKPKTSKELLDEIESWK
mgnify:CR=1 FL=1|jgi:hypothetical protein